MPRTTSQAKLQLWKERFQQFHQGHQTIEQFCQSLGCTSATFHYWQRRIEPADKSKVATSLVESSAFIPVVLRGGSSRPVMVRANDGTRISVPVDALSALQVVLQHAERVAR